MCIDVIDVRRNNKTFNKIKKFVIRNGEVGKWANGNIIIFNVIVSCWLLVGIPNDFLTRLFEFVVMFSLQTINYNCFMVFFCFCRMPYAVGRLVVYWSGIVLYYYYCCFPFFTLELEVIRSHSILFFFFRFSLPFSSLPLWLVCYRLCSLNPLYV